jgi:hypothetical protein
MTVTFRHRFWASCWVQWALDKSMTPLKLHSKRASQREHDLPPYRRTPKTSGKTDNTTLSSSTTKRISVMATASKQPTSTLSSQLRVHYGVPQGSSSRRDQLPFTSYRMLLRPHLRSFGDVHGFVRRRAQGESDLYAQHFFWNINLHDIFKHDFYGVQNLCIQLVQIFLRMT